MTNLFIKKSPKIINLTRMPKLVIYVLKIVFKKNVS